MMDFYYENDEKDFMTQVVMEMTDEELDAFADCLEQSIKYEDEMSERKCYKYESH